jgi:cytochrome c biogenesis protein CcmG/thiol:disulfide interchange protein DsbE
MGRRELAVIRTRLLNTINRRSPWLSLMAVTFAVGLAWIWLSAVPGSAKNGDLIPSPREGFLAPDFTLERIDGETLTLSDLRGRVVVINFWASWCPPCRAEMPALQEVYENNRGQGLGILAVNATYQDQEAEAKALANEMDLSFPILLERTGEMAREYQLRAMPSTFFIDREGVIRKVILGGPMSEATLQTAVEELLEEMP